MEQGSPAIAWALCRGVCETGPQGQAPCSASGARGQGFQLSRSGGMRSIWVPVVLCFPKESVAVLYNELVHD